MSNRTHRRKTRGKSQHDRAMEAAAVDMLRSMDGRTHPRAYDAKTLRAMILADILSGAHTESPPHLWFMIVGVARISRLERRAQETVTTELLTEAESIRPGVTLS